MTRSVHSVDVQHPSESMIGSRGGEPYVVGVIGDFDPVLLETMADGRDLKSRSLIDGSCLLSDRPLGVWEARSARGVYWGSRPSSVVPRDLAEFRSTVGAAGVAEIDGVVSLHGDRLGVRPLYYIRRGGGVYFSNRLSGVMAICPRLELDQQSWAGMLALWYVPPGRSVLAGVSTLSVGEVICFDSRLRSLSTRREDVAVETRSGATLEELVEAIARSMNQPTKSQLFLSGGFDSRFLAACATRQGLDVEAVTTSLDDGRDLDIDFARRVADRLAIPHLAVTADETSWDDWFRMASERMDFATPHHAWSWPIGKLVRTVGRPAIMGFGVGIVFNDHMQDRSMDREGRSSDARFALFDRLSGDVLDVDLPLVEKALGAHFDRLALEFVETSAQFADRPDWQMWSILTTRTARSISAIATRIAGPDIEVSLPYLDAVVLEVVLDPDWHAQRGNGLYRKFIKSLDPKLAEIPATSEITDSPTTYEPRQSRPKTLAAIAAAIASDEVALSMLERRLRDIIVQGELTTVKDLVGWTSHKRVIYGALLMASFRARYPQIGGFA